MIAEQWDKSGCQCKVPGHSGIASPGWVGSNSWGVGSTSLQSEFRDYTSSSPIPCIPSHTSAGTSIRSPGSWCSRPRHRSWELQTRRTEFLADCTPARNRCHCHCHCHCHRGRQSPRACRPRTSIPNARSRSSKPRRRCRSPPGSTLHRSPRTHAQCRRR